MAEVHRLLSKLKSAAQLTTDQRTADPRTTEWIQHAPIEDRDSLGQLRAYVDKNGNTFFFKYNDRRILMEAVVPIEGRTYVFRIDRRGHWQEFLHRKIGDDLLVQSEVFGFSVREVIGIDNLIALELLGVPNGDGETINITNFPDGSSLHRQAKTGNIVKMIDIKDGAYQAVYNGEGRVVKLTGAFNGIRARYEKTGTGWKTFTAFETAKGESWHLDRSVFTNMEILVDQTSGDLFIRNGPQGYIEHRREGKERFDPSWQDKRLLNCH
jgi:hypothetical protein